MTLRHPNFREIALGVLKLPLYVAGIVCVFRIFYSANPVKCSRLQSHTTIP
jgi:hypothetical protein